MNNSVINLPYKITNAFVKAHPDYIFLYGNDVMKKGCFGQSAIAGYENTICIHVLYKFCASGARYFTDGDTEAKRIIDFDISCIPLDGRPIIPLRRIGEGCSRMKELAPKLHAYMVERIDAIKHPHLLWDFNIRYGLDY